MLRRVGRSVALGCCWFGVVALAARHGLAQDLPPEPAQPGATEAAPAAPADPGTPTAPSTPPSDAVAGSPDPASLAPGERPDEPRFRDANVDRVILFSTAETHPKNTFFFSDYELILLQFGYAVSDRVQLALTGVPPLVENQPYFFDLSVKANVFRDDIFRMAVIGGGIVVVVPDVSTDTLLGARLNGVGQFCFDTNCKSSFSANVGTILNNQSNEVFPVLLAGGFVVHASSIVKLLAEPTYSLAIGDNTDQPDGFLLNYGVRLSGTHFGFDLAFLKPLGFGDDDVFILGLPWVALTYRSAGDRPHGVKEP